MSDGNQKVNQNGRPVYLFSPSQKEAASTAQDTSTYIGVLTNSTKLIEKNNFSWGLLHSKNTPPFSLERIKKATSASMYYHKPENTGNQVFRGNRYRGVSNVGEVANKFDKMGGRLGKGGDIAEIGILTRERDSKGLVVKAATMAGSTYGENRGLALAGRICPKLAKGSPQKAVLVGGSCFGTLFFLGNKAGDAAGKVIGGSKVGQKLGESQAAVTIVNGLADAADLMEAQEKATAEAERQRQLEKDPMLEWHIMGAD
ncbi:hypothetical protein RFK95_18710 [Acinetobacter pittii]|uniref:Uncharacterized protein n=1 Tax=Acinetobacter pittii TaxID=48296 RepID=A0AB37TE39_ACIPI|nr:MULTISPECIES: hypothetical protein [Acinetobacter]KQF34917.1 hypothetical protein APC05_03415 [Acinetobacter pittii]MBM0877643.1 hypothetical protein [Acinetobacter pittii]MDQ9034886.1 hypothetical protein [Acinetobacter pittii]MDQ9079843.1 hypothetical protein [Acinetobacter pittii]OTL80246.1 hypothetical protein B9X62_19080 [Acinetobacter pittii]